jgi:ABC-type multidrug transport system ATPase subunit
VKHYLEVKTIHKSYRDKPVLNGICLRIDRPGVYLIAGPNGSGKTTLLESLVGLRKTDSGTIAIDGITNPLHLKRKVGFLLQGNSLRKNLTVKEEMGLMKDLFHLKINDREYLKSFHLEEYYQTKTQKLSGGTKRRVLLMLIFMPDYPILILDEPASGLDTQSRSVIWNTIKKFSKEKIIIVSDHYLNQAANYSDYIYFLNQGKIIYEGWQKEILQNFDKTHVINMNAEDYEKAAPYLANIDGKHATIVMDGLSHVFVNVREKESVRKIFDLLPNPNIIIDYHTVDFEDIYFYLTGNKKIYEREDS